MVIINMLCQYCEVLAELFCRCSVLLCKDHALIHLRRCKSGLVTNIEDKKIDFSSEASKRVNKINKFCCDIVEKTSELVRRIKILCRKSVIKLENLKENYLSILESGLTKDKLEEMEVKQVESPDVEVIERYYNKKFIIDKKRLILQTLIMGRIGLRKIMN